MSFKFDFDLEPDTEDSANDVFNNDANIQQTDICKADVIVEPKHIVPSKEIKADFQAQDGNSVDIQLFNIGQKNLRCICVSKIEEQLKNKEDSDISRALLDNSDLVPHVYEGGFKIWECSIDLIQYFTRHNVAFHGMKILELGCGAGLPGLFALLNGAAKVHFQDYNEEVIHKVTIPNVALNSTDDVNLFTRTRFFAGDWADLADTVIKSTDDVKYDIILSSETIYSCEAYIHLHDVMARLLKRDGKIYVAAKTCYFGVGGGTREFEQYVIKHSTFDTVVLETITEGIQREILQLTLKSDENS